MTTLLLILVFATINVGLGCWLFLVFLGPRIAAAPQASAPTPAGSSEEADEEEPVQKPAKDDVGANIEAALASIEKQLAALAQDIDSNAIKKMTDELSAAVAAQLKAWSSEYDELDDSDESNERRGYLEQRIAQAETTSNNLAQIKWDGELGDVISRVNTEVKRMQRA